nr:glycosyltransferase family 2 protein [Pseudoruegeria sp. HB172150]
MDIRPGSPNDPLVTVVTPVYNALSTLERTVDSVRAQDFGDWELILSDDGSTDGSDDLAQRLACKDPRIRFLPHACNTGAAQARNRALGVARGQFVAFLDADDEWLPHKLRRQIQFMRETGAAFTYSGYLRVRGSRRREVRVPPSVDYAGLLGGNVIGCLTAVYDTAQLGRVEMPDLRLRQDYALWLKLLRQVDCARAVPEPLALHHLRTGSLSSARWAALRATWTLYRQVEGLPRHRAATCLTRHLTRRLFN